MIQEIDKEVLIKLRDCQLRSIETIVKYISSKSNKSCLISLPTGAGKSGVICTLSNYINFSKVLVVTHRRAVCDQLYKQLKGEFFEKILSTECDVNKFLKKKVYNQIKNTTKDGIYCTTFQMLTSIGESNLILLKDAFELILIDEGHAEPAPKWGNAIRLLNSKKVIITATPYRNDLFNFDIDIDHSFIYSYKEAIKENIIVEPSFENVSIDEIFDKINDIRIIQPDSVCIIKCDKFSDIEYYFSLFESKYRTAAIHDRYKNRVMANKFGDVPKNLKNLNYEILIHQKMLDEGIDIPESKILILTYAIGSGKELVQTIGRIVRVYKKYLPKVLELKNIEQKNYNIWSNYLAFDSYISNKKSAKRFLKTLNTSNLIESYLDAFPEYSYYGSNYTKKFDFEKFDPIDSLEIPLASVCFYFKQEGFSINDCLDKLYWEFIREGALCKPANSELGIIISICFNNSKFLKDSLFFEPSLEIMIIREFEDIVAIFDSRGRKFNGRDDLKIGRAIGADNLFSIASSENSITVTKQASTRALQNSTAQAESILLKGPNLELINQPQSNSSYAVTTSIVSTLNQNEKIQESYYFGIASGRVCDQKNINFNYEEFIDWLSEINKKFIANRKVDSQFLNSFAQVIDNMPYKDPVAYILDLSSTEFINLELIYEGISYPIENNFIYRKNISGFMIHNFYHKNKFYRLPFRSFLDKNLLIKFIFDKDLNIIPVCSSEIQFSLNGIIIESKEVFNNKTVKMLYSDGISYLNGGFYQLRLPTDSNKINPNILRNIISLDCLKRVGLSEKDEEHLTPESFGGNSIFYLVDQLSNIHNSTVLNSELGDFYSYIPNVDLVLCTDMDTEPADFILSSKDKVVFVHIKCGTSPLKPESSAGAICEVGGQALKNLHWLIHEGKSKYANDTVLNQLWPRLNGSKPHKVKLNTRIRLFNKKTDLNHDLEEVIETIDTRRHNPLVSKEIWVIVGNSFSRGHFINQFNNLSLASPETIQAYQLLDTWFNQASSNNVSLKFFVSE